MDSVNALFAGLLVGELLIMGLSVKTIAVMLLQPQGTAAGRSVAWLWALFVMLIGAGTAAATLMALIPAHWSGDVYLPLLLACYGVSVAIPIFWAVTKSRREAQSPLHVAVRTPEPASTMHPQETASATRQVWPHPGLAAGLEAIRRQRHAHARDMSLFILVIAIPIACFIGYKHGLLGSGAIALGAMLVMMDCFKGVGNVSGIQYRTLPGSSDASGKHRCVYCGKPGVYRQGAYASSSTWHECTGCRKHLFVD